MSGQYNQDETVQSQRSHNFFNALLFPANLTGLGHIGIFTTCFLLLGLARHSGIMLIWFAVGFIGLMISIELVNYLCHCIRESSVGARVAPASLFAASFDCGSASFTLGGYLNLHGEFLGMLIPVLICFLPAWLYLTFTGQFNPISALLLVVGTFYFPMFSLAVVVFNSSSGYNPFIHLMSILSTFFSYCLLVFQVSLVIGGSVYLIHLFQHSMIGAFLLLPVQLYLVMVMMHLLGRFYYLNQGKLNWEV